MSEFAGLIEPVARQLLGEPNKRLSKAGEMRFGENGSLKVVTAGVAAGTFADFEAGTGGGLLDLIVRERGGNRADAKTWLDENFGAPEQVTRRKRIAAVYDYHDEAGATEFQVVRYDPKEFRQRRNETSWTVAGVRTLPYRLPEVIDAIAADRQVFVVEGEKDCDRLARMNIAATCNAGGAGKWRAEHAAYLKGADVVILPDNDEAGERHGDIVARSLLGIARSIRVVALPGLARKGDVSDWLDAGKGVEALNSAVEAASEWRPESRMKLTWLGDEDRIPPIRWLIKGVLGCNCLSVVYAPSGGGKSFFALDLAARVAAGMLFFDHPVRQGPVLYVAGEGATGFRSRMKAWRLQHPDSAGAPFAMMPASLDLLSTKTEAVETIQDAIEEIGEQTGEKVQLIVLDTLSRMMPGGVDSEPKDVKAFLENADRLREATGAHVMILHHAGKDVERGMRGSSLLKDYADTVIEIKGGEADGPMRAIVQKQKDGEDGREYRFRLLQSTVGYDEDGDAITSCVVDPIGASAGPEPVHGARLSDREQIAVRCLAELLAGEGVTRVTSVTSGQCHAVTLDTWRDTVRNRLGTETDAAFRKAWERIKNKLLARYVIEVDNGLVWLCDSPVTA